jgi:tetratricopeptide (TPR) repeat protein
MRGVEAYRLGEYGAAADSFAAEVARAPSSAAFYNLGNAEWQRQRFGHAILAWERALWLNRFSRDARNNLEVARRTGQLPGPELAWYEVISSWLPVNVWAWITGGSLWLAVGVMVLPGTFRRRKQAWHQAAAALGLTIFLLGIPRKLACIRAQARLRDREERALRLTPPPMSKPDLLAPGEPLRVQRWRATTLSPEHHVATVGCIAVISSW